MPHDTPRLYLEGKPLVESIDAVRVTGWARTVIQDQIEEGRFPPPVYFYPDRWLSTHLLEWLDGRRDWGKPEADPDTEVDEIAIHFLDRGCYVEYMDEGKVVETVGFHCLADALHELERLE